MSDNLDPNSLNKPPLFHIALRLDGQRCLVVGGGPVGTHKAESLAACGALVTVVAPEISPRLENLGVKLEQRPYEASDLDGCRLVVAATGVPAVDREVYADARQRGVLVNAADDPEACEYIVPAVTRIGPVSVAVSTGGLSPYLAGWIKRQIAEVLPPEVGELATLVGRCRSSLRASGLSSEDADWDSLVDGLLWPLVREDRSDEAAAAAEAWVEAERARLSQI
ncbi:MAG: bifunctional precorrin-2 dehydrogenase/sirohydrochlorin ferrochelatase [Acidimicrobiales bacterium]